jgi:small subunit ribosomal protein S6
MTRAYEIAVVLNPQLSDSEIERFLHTLRQTFTKLEVEVQEEDLWGRRETAYRLQGNGEGYYAFFKVNMPSDKVAAVEQNLKLNETVLRHLIIIEEK